MVAADDDRVSLGREAGDHADMSAAAATHGHDSADLRCDVLMLLPGQGAIIDILGPGDLAQESGAPEGAADANLMGSHADELTGALDDADAALEA